MASMTNISKNVRIEDVITPTAGVAGTTTINGSTVDMSGFEGVLFVIRFGTITATAVTSIKAQQGAAANMSDAADLAGTGQTILDTDDDKVFYIDLYRPLERYVRPVVLRGTANAVVASCEAIKYGAKKVPTAHGAGVAGETWAGPSEGAA